MTVTLQQLKDELSVASTMTKTKPQFLTEALTEVLNNEWKVNAIESNRSVYHQLEVEEGRKSARVGNEDKFVGHEDRYQNVKESKAKELKEAITKIANAKRIFLNNKRIK